MAQKNIKLVQNKMKLTQEELDFIEIVKKNPIMPEYIEFYLAGVI